MMVNSGVICLLHFNLIPPNEYYDTEKKTKKNKSFLHILFANTLSRFKPDLSVSLTMAINVYQTCFKVLLTGMKNMSESTWPWRTATLVIYGHSVECY